jgi:hypothetical protein
MKGKNGKYNFANTMIKKLNWYFFANTPPKHDICIEFDADLRIGLRLETGRRSESYIYTIVVPLCTMLFECKYVHTFIVC